MSALESNVLVLNRCYQPIHITTVRRAFSLLYQGIAHAIDREYKTFDYESWAALSADIRDNDVIHTVSQAIRIPRVIVLQFFDHLPKRQIRFSRQNIYLRDQCTCQYCGRKRLRSHLNLDHVIPRSQGGRTTWTNVVCSCISCNLKKGGRTPAQAGMALLKAPIKPRWSPFSRPKDGSMPHEQWRPFLNIADAAYWNAELEDE